MRYIHRVLRPDRLKIVSFLVFVVAFVPILSYDNGIRCIRAPCPSSSIGSLLFYLIGYHGAVYEIHFAALLIGLIASYLIACLLANLYYSVKK